VGHECGSVSNNTAMRTSDHKTTRRLLDCEIVDLSSAEHHTGCKNACLVLCGSTKQTRSFFCSSRPGILLLRGGGALICHLVVIWLCNSACIKKEHY
jgi:hypothetical protein